MQTYNRKKYLLKQATLIKAPVLSLVQSVIANE